MNADFLHILNAFAERARQWGNMLIDQTPNLVLAVIIFIFGCYLAGVLRRGAVRLLRSRQVKPSACNMLGNITSITVVLIFMLLALDVLDLDNMLKTLLAGAGVAGLAIGLALQGTLSNTFSGITLSFIKDLRIGDQVETNGHIGVIEDINLRVIKLRTLDDNLVSIPNKIIIENPLKNFSASSHTRIMLSCGVAYDSDLDLVQQLVLTTLSNDVTGVMDVPPVAFTYTEFADSSINFEVRFSAPSKSIADTAAKKSEAIVAIKKCFDKNRITIPFPIRTLDFPGGAADRGTSE